MMPMANMPLQQLDISVVIKGRICDLSLQNHEYDQAG